MIHRLSGGIWIMKSGYFRVSKNRFKKYIVKFQCISIMKYNISISFLEVPHAIFQGTRLMDKNAIIIINEIDLLQKCRSFCQIIYISEVDRIN